MTSNQSSTERSWPSPIVVLVLMAAFALPAVLWFINSGGDTASPPGSNQTEPIASVQPTATNDVDTSSASATIDDDTSGCHLNADLETRVRCFVQAWYLLEPTDSTATKQARIAPYASELFMSQESAKMTVMTDTLADQARITQEITQSVQATGEVLLTPDDTTPSLVRAVTTATLFSSTPTSSPTINLTLYTNTVWRQTDGVWLVESIEDVGG